MATTQSDNFKKTQINQLKDMKGYAYISEGKAMVYAGTNNWPRAAEYAKKNKMVPIGSTRPGKVLDSVANFKEKSISNEDKQAIWNSASRSYAAEIKGNVRTFVAGANQESIFRKTELSTILNNKKVETINGLERTKIDQARRQRFETLRKQGVERREAAINANGTAHRKVAVQEIRQDLQTAKQEKDEALKKDALHRLESLKAQNKKEVQQAQNLKIDQERQKKIEQEKAVQKYDAERFKKIEQKNFEKLTAQGLKQEHALKAAQDRVRHLKEKLVLNEERNALKQKGEQLKLKDAQTYQEKLTEFRNRQIADYKSQAQRQNTVYKGPPQSDVTLSTKANNANAQAFVQKTRLDSAYKSGRFTESEYKKRISSIEQNKDQSISRSLGQKQENGQQIEQTQSNTLSHGLH